MIYTFLKYNVLLAIKYYTLSVKSQFCLNLCYFIVNYNFEIYDQKILSY